ncbi:protein POLYCHOME-like [Eucalyptus grandis]|uniref:protein POLYCHOME-like n=1 Tax=Eucalyptus grandis TaxID=71139 RepID=UPI00192EC81C|nr:protein POLYCHOME-like [Eucalyptus grandis]
MTKASGNTRSARRRAGAEFESLRTRGGAASSWSRGSTGAGGIGPRWCGGREGRFGDSKKREGGGRNLFATPLVGRENTPPGGSARRGRGRPDSVLPSWYPRTPLRDITTVVRAYERRRARLAEIEGRQVDTPVATELTTGESSVPRTRAPLEHDVSLYTPGPAVPEKPCPISVGKVPKILLDITNQTSVGDSEFLTPQKKLLNQIDTVEKVVMDELKRLKRTPSAKKAERQKSSYTDVDAMMHR